MHYNRLSTYSLSGRLFQKKIRHYDLEFSTCLDLLLLNGFLYAPINTSEINTSEINTSEINPKEKK